jgi:hypothetical protein
MVYAAKELHSLSRDNLRNRFRVLPWERIQKRTKGKNRGMEAGKFNPPVLLKKSG